MFHKPCCIRRGVCRIPQYTMGNLPTYQVHQLSKNQISGSATNLIFLWPSAICAQIREPDIRLLQPDFIACSLSRDLSGCPTWYLVPVLRPNLIFGSCVKLDSVTVGWHRQRTWFLVHVVHVGNLGRGSIQELMRTIPDLQSELHSSKSACQEPVCRESWSLPSTFSANRLLARADLRPFELHRREQQ